MRKKLVGIAAASALVLAACGSDDEPEAAEPESTEAMADEPESTEAMEDEPESTEAMEDEPESTEAMDDDGDGARFAVDTSACEDPDAAIAPFEDSIRIGTSVPLSGGPAVLFAPFAAGQQAYIDYYNAEVGGVDGLPLELITKDDQYTADLTVANVDELVFDEEVDLLAGIIGTPNNLAVQDDLNAQCIPQLAASTGAPNWGAVDEYPWTTGLLIPYAIEAQVWAQYAAEQGATTAALFYVNNEFGQSYVEPFEAAAAENGIEIVGTETIEAADSAAPSAQVTNLVAANPDTILAIPLGAQCIAFMTEIGNARAANADFDPLVYQTATCRSPIFFGGVSNGGADGVYTGYNVKDVNDPANAEDPAVAEYLDAFASTGSDADPGGVAVAGWLAMEVTVHLLEEAAAEGNLSREGVINAARNLDFTPGLLLDGLRNVMGPDDGYAAEGLQIQQWSDDSTSFVAVGDPIDLEGTLGVYAG